MLYRRAVRHRTIALSLSLLLGVGLVLGKPFLLPRDLPGRSGVDVLTQHNDIGRTGATLHETLLNTTDVNVKTFGKLFTRPVDGQIYAQPLYVSALHIPHKGTHNVVFVATMHASVYAFDADDPAASTALWQVTLGASIPVTNADFGGRYGPYRDITVEIGIVSTPAIDRATDTIYVLAANRDSDGRYVHRLHALDLGTGAEKFGGPIETQGSVPGRGVGSLDGMVTFDNKQQVQRAGLLLANGLVYVAFAGYADTDPYHGWIFAYDAHSLQRKAIFNDTPNGGEGGIWQAGWGPAADASGHVYLATGNGDWDAGGGGTNYGDSFLKLSPTLTVDDWFTPWNQADLLDDQDLGATGLMLIPGPTGLMLIPGPHLLVSGDKQGTLYLLKQDAMGHYNRHGDTQIVQRFQATKGPIHGGTVFWDGPTGDQVYVWSANDGLKAFRLSDGIFQTTPAAQSTMTIPPPGFPGSMLALSANGSAAGSGIVWALCPYSGDASTGTALGILRAFDASDVSKELWNSTQDAARDDVGSFAKFNTPTIANGKVYVPTFSGYLAVYGLLPPTRR